MVHVVLDFETRSEADLPETGSYVYATHPSTEILCVAWRWAHSKEELETAPTHSWSPAFKREADADFLALLQDPKVVKVAHNALFEQLITRFVLPKYTKKKLREIPPSEWICTASLAATHALPRALEGAAGVLGCSVQKDMEGSRLINKYCKPRKPTKNNPAKWHKKVSELKRIIEYCVTDIGATVGVFLALPPLIPTERKVWELDQVINIRGFYVDQDLVREALRMVEIETTRLVKECEKLTGGLRPSQREKILAWVHRQGFKIPDLKSKTLERELRKKDVPAKARALLEIRQAVSKTSTAKYVAFRNRTSADGRLRDTKLYHGASTGRDAGRGVQPTNFPRGTLGASADDAAAVVKTGDIELLRLLYGNPLDTLSSCLRSVIEATPGYEMSAIDWNAIEVRVLFWIADHAEGLQAYAEKRDLYREMACRIYNKILDEISKEEREVGKRAVLGCGYQMAGEKFKSSLLEQYAMEIERELADTAVVAYRELHGPVKKLWGRLERAAITATQNPGKRYSINHTKWWVSSRDDRNRFLYCELPSGRRLAYYGPSIRWEKRTKKVKVLRQGKEVEVRQPYGNKIPKLYHWSVHPKTNQWVNGATYGGRLTENVVQGTARDVMAETMLKAEGPWRMLLTVYDELVTESKKGTRKVSELEKLAEIPPTWAPGLSLKAGGWTGERYRKG